jgi:hypothetical protein
MGAHPSSHLSCTAWNITISISPSPGKPRSHYSRRQLHLCYAGAPLFRIGAGLVTALRAGWPCPSGIRMDEIFPRPGADKTAVRKVTFITRVGDLGCGVGYYK